MKVRTEERNGIPFIAWVGIIFLLMVAGCKLIGGGGDSSSGGSTARYCTSAWNGQIGAAVRATKAQLKDPGSFEHIETRVYPKGAEIEFTMRFRARNGFGGFGTSTAYGKVNKGNCTLIGSVYIP